MKFKTISPYFERERDGLKCNTVRKVDDDDARYPILYHLLDSENIEQTIEIVNPENGDLFERWITDVCFFDERWIISWKHQEDTNDIKSKTEAKENE